MAVLHVRPWTSFTRRFAEQEMEDICQFPAAVLSQSVSLLTITGFAEGKTRLQSVQRRVHRQYAVIGLKLKSSVCGKQRTVENSKPTVEKDCCYYYYHHY